MRLDKFLKISRIIKRRTVANEMASLGRIQVNGRVAKPGTEVKAGDEIELSFGQGNSCVRILKVQENARKEEADELYEILPANASELNDSNGCDSNDNDSNTK